MPKKNMTPEERKAFGEKMKAAREAKQNGEKVTLDKDQYDALLRRMERLEAGTTTPAIENQSTVNDDGRPVGITEKYSIDPLEYEDPREKLYDMPEFKRDALRENYKLNYKVAPIRYQTVFGTWYIEPKFEMEILRRRFDDETGQEKPAIYLGRMSCFIDPGADLSEAEQAHLDYRTMDAAEFAAAMRMWRWRHFIAETLRPPRPTKAPRGSAMEVIGGKVYELEQYQQVIQ